MRLIRVRYCKPSTPLEDREYQIDGTGPVGTLKEFKAWSNCDYEIFERE